MDWFKQIGNVLDRYGDTDPTQAPGEVNEHFDQFSKVAPRAAVADGISAAFRSPQTPPFPNMLANLFGRSSGTQRASILRMLASTVGPALISQVLQRRGQRDAAVAAETDVASPQVAEHVPPEAVEEIAAAAEKRDPSIIDRISTAYADQPQIVKTLGGAALAVALAHFATKQRAR